MTKKLEEEFNLPPLNEVLKESTDAPEPTIEETTTEIQIVNDALSVTEKINDAFKQIKGLDDHETEMDDVALKAIDSYEQLMQLGMNVSDMAAGKVFAEASNMLKIALEAKDSKTRAKLQQIDLMIKKARLDKTKNHNESDDPSTLSPTKIYDRNELLRIIKEG